MNTEYDRSDPVSIENYAKGLIGRTFRNIVESDNNQAENLVSDDGGFSRKGGLGILLEERYFHYKANSDSRPDFDEAGVELKVTPYRYNSKNERVAKERLVITMIDYMAVIDEAFDNSHLWLKARLMLLVYYLYQKEIRDRLDYRIDFVSLFTPPEEDLAIIKADFEKIVEKIRQGKAHELSEGDTMYLAACTKSSDSTVRRAQPFSNVPAKPRAFSLKSSYMTYVLNNYIVPNSRKVDAIVTGDKIVSFEQYVTDRINAHKGKTEDQLCAEFDIPLKDNRPKNLEAIIAYRILGVKSNKAEEFEKAGIRVKTIRVEENGSVRESMSFPAMEFSKIANEEWDTSDFCRYLDETRFFFVIYKFDKNHTLRLQGCKFWNIPYRDMLEVKRVWLKTKMLLSGGLEFERINGKYQSNLPKASESEVCHVRPHGRNAEDVDFLPDGRQYPKQCFWLNREYIKAQIADILD